MSETFSKVEVITGVARRRRFTTGQKLSVVNETLQPGMSISYVARRMNLGTDAAPAELSFPFV
jgi:transposase